MNWKILAAFMIFLCIAMGCAALGLKEAEKATPVITQSFASKEVRLGETWKIYLNASDPNGEMIKISAIVDQTGQNNPERITKVGKENGKEFSGYLNLSTASLANVLDGTSITLWVQVQDKSGNLSQPVVFPLTIKKVATQEVPPQGVFRERDLGPMVAQKSLLGSWMDYGSTTSGGSNNPNAPSTGFPPNPASGRRQPGK